MEISGQSNAQHNYYIESYSTQLSVLFALVNSLITNWNSWQPVVPAYICFVTKPRKREQMLPEKMASANSKLLSQQQMVEDKNFLQLLRVSQFICALWKIMKSLESVVILI